MRVFVVEDEPIILTTISKALTKEGMTVGTATTAREAFGKLVEFEPDLLILDQMLPDRDGTFILEKVRSSKKWHAMPTVMLTSSNDNEVLSKALKLKIDDYMIKPFNPREHVGRILKQVASICVDDLVLRFNEIHLADPSMFRHFDANLYKEGFDAYPVEWKGRKIAIVVPNQYNLPFLANKSAKQVAQIIAVWGQFRAGWVKMSLTIR